MPLTLELPDDLAGALADEAARAGMSLPDYAVRLLASAHPPTAAPRTGADLVAFWQAGGLVGTRPDGEDSPALARRLRDEAERRDRSPP